MKTKPDPRGERKRPAQHRLILPTILALALFYGALLLNGIAPGGADDRERLRILIGVSGVIYAILLYCFIIPHYERTQRNRWGWTAVNTASLILLAFAVEREQAVILYGAAILASVLTAATAGRRPAFVLVLGVAAADIVRSWEPGSFAGWITLLLPYLAGMALTGTIARLQAADATHIRQLEILSDFARRVGASIEVEQVISSLHQAIQDSFDADTYYVAFARGEQLEYSLLYEHGKHQHGLKTPLNASLAGRVILEKRPLFIPDLVKERARLGFPQSGTARSKANISWMGAPLLSRDGLAGVLAIASQRAAAFDEADFELLQNLARQFSLALDNAYHHAEVEAQSRLDSLTKVYNHGYFLESLQTCAAQARATNEVLSLIMLDIDQFKQYNDTYGHLVGDKVLVALANTIQQHIESNDSVGRWGGEEFVILLRHADGSQAHQVAGRISATVSTLEIFDRDGTPVPAPTVSQGIAVFPDETEDIFKLVDLADRRLYVAKEHGRNQVRPEEKHWKSIRSPRRKEG